MVRTSTTCGASSLNDGTYAVVSNFSMITLINGLDSLRHATTAAERGTYSSKAKVKPATKEETVQYSATKSNQFKPVSFQAN